MRLEAVAKDGRKVVLKYAHEDLEVCVGIATAAFVVATLRGDVSPATTLVTQCYTFCLAFTALQVCSLLSESPTLRCLSRLC